MAAAPGSRAARAEACALRPCWARVVGASGWRRGLAGCASALGVAASARAICGDFHGVSLVIGDSGAFGRALGLWFALNSCLCLLLGVVDAAPFGANVDDARFRRYPLFSWLTPGVQQALFFLPAAAYLAWAAVDAARGGDRGGWPARAPWERALVLHCVPSVAGMQFRELLLFESDAMMHAHHAATIALISLAWRGLRPYPDDAAWVLATAASTAAMETGSLACVVWTVSGGGTARWKAVYAVLMCASHASVLASGIFGNVWRRPDVPVFWLVFGATLPLVYARHDYMVKEIRAGVASGAFVDDDAAAEKRD